MIISQLPEAMVNTTMDTIQRNCTDLIGMYIIFIFNRIMLSDFVIKWVLYLNMKYKKM